MKKLAGKILILVGAVAGLSLVSGCEAPCTRTVSQAEINAVNQTQLQTDIAAIDQYLVNNGIVASNDPSGIRYTVDTPGTGAKPCLENTVTVRYTGKLLSTGNVFDSSANPVSFALSNLILGWRIMLPQFQAGSIITLYIPSGFAYGTRGAGTSIPANANLIFTIELVR
ncbi:MAG: FKBP-type peptidyl-prolyl cis-trans isomerase [Cyclobacteriaceae bacterium]|jgi:FKBP-type peptidyl-prolyl cis-trans isomerase|nr:FKBP-type peptidyl-prolyl cis-trans isomerase [Cyclobacteriaceae bacterium]